jgi:hypothetical protein
VSTNETSGYLALKRLWQQLPPTMHSEDEHNLVTDKSVATIIRVAGLGDGTRGKPLDYAGATSRRAMLLRLGALKARRSGNGTIEFTKSETFPEPPDPHEWVDRANKEIREKAAEEQWKFAHEANARQAAADALNAPVVGAQRADFAYLLKENGLDPMSLAATIEAAVERVLQAHGLLETVTAGAGPQERY